MEDFLLLDKFLLSQTKIIHQIWFGTIPNKSKAKKAYNQMKLYRDSWIDKNPNWIRIEWNKNLCIQLIKNFYLEHLEMFEKYHYEIQRCDMIRYLILHRYGGFYIDMDYFCNRPLDEARERFTNDIYFVQSPNSFMQDEDHISNSMMFSVKNHPFWKQVMLELEKNQTTPYYYTKHLAVMFTTGPGILNRIYSKYKYKYKVKSLPWKLFHPFGIKDEKMSLTGNKDVYCVHVGKGSWENKDSKILLFFARSWGIIIFIILIMFFPIIFSISNRILFGCN